MGEHGFSERHATAAAANAARALARGDVSARWRAAEDGSIDVVRDANARVELYRIGRDGVPSLVERSSVSWARASRAALFYAAFAVLAGAFIGLAVADEMENEALADVFQATFGLTFFSMFVIALVTPSDDRAVRRWITRRYGSDAGWARVPRQADIGPATGSQQVAASTLADASHRHALARLRDDGTLEVARWTGGAITIEEVGRDGVVTHVTREPTRSWLPALAFAACAAAGVVVAVAAEGPLAWAAGLTVPISVLLTFAKAPSMRDVATGEGWHDVRTDDPDD
jgi:hypothetical protein